MAAEHNLIPAAQYARLMKIQKQLDDNNNSHKKKVTQTPTKENGALSSDDKDNDKTDDPSNDMHASGGDDVGSGEVSNHVDTGETKEGKIAEPDHKKADSLSDTDNNNKNNNDEDLDLPDIPRITTKRKRKAIKKENIEDIVVQFSGRLRNKVKRLIVYMFRFGRDITIKKGLLFYKTEQIGDVVKLVKSLFGVGPKLPGVGRLRRLLFILSVPSELFTLSTSERKEMGHLEKSHEKKDPIDWIKY